MKHQLKNNQFRRPGIGALREKLIYTLETYFEKITLLRSQLIETKMNKDEKFTDDISIYALTKTLGKTFDTEMKEWGTSVFIYCARTGDKDVQDMAKHIEYIHQCLCEVESVAKGDLDVRCSKDT